MRRIRYLSYCDYVIQLGQKTGQPVPLSQNILVERSRAMDSRRPTELGIHAKFDSYNMNGVQVLAQLSKGAKVFRSAVSYARLNIVNEQTWQESLVTAISFTADNQGVMSAYIPQSTLGLNELSGRECYSIEVGLSRRGKVYRRKVWFNHLGSYDHLLVLKRMIEANAITKADD